MSINRKLFDEQEIEQIVNSFGIEDVQFEDLLKNEAKTDLYNKLVKYGQDIDEITQIMQTEDLNDDEINDAKHKLSQSQLGYTIISNEITDLNEGGPSQEIQFQTFQKLLRRASSPLMLRSNINQQ